jgi:hypothetical protein
MERSPSLVQRALRRPQVRRRRLLSRAWTHRLLGGALACATCWLLSGCAGAQPAGSTSALRSRVPGAGLTAASSPSTRSLAALHPTKAQALAFARAVNLTVADIPEGRVSKKERKSSSRDRHEFELCVGRAWNQHKLADIGSPPFLRGHELETEWIGSDVTVATSVSVADGLLARLQRPEVRHCLAHLWTRSLGRTAIRNAYWGPVAIYALPVQAPGSSHRIGLRIAMTVHIPANEVTVPAYVDVLGFAWGSAEIALTATSVTQPVPPSVENQLLATLLARARSHTL